MPLTIADLEKLGQDYPIETAVALSVRDIPDIPAPNEQIEYLSLQLNGRNPIDAVILQGLLPYKANGKSVSGLIRLLLYHYFTHNLR